MDYLQKQYEISIKLRINVKYIYPKLYYIIPNNQNESLDQDFSLHSLSTLAYIILEYFRDQREEHRTEDLSSLKRICDK